ncbi:MAG: YncE family protein [Thermotogota bacterium]
MEGRGFGLFIALIVVVALVGGPASTAKAEAAVGFVVYDLQLISTTSKLDWTNRWTAPVEAATIMAWFHGHDYPDLLADLNGDGAIDELDTIELADRFGKTSMETGSPRGTTDPFLVFGLAKYVAGKYPGVFELKIYDAGFPAEFQRDIGVPFSPDAVRGITLTLKPEPNHAAYQSELRDGQGVVVGIEQQMDRNQYLAGRSFLFDKLEDGNYGIDLAWAEDDPWQPGAQGQVLQTEAKDTDVLYLNYQGAWTKVECMLALSPMQKPPQPVSGGESALSQPPAGGESAVSPPLCPCGGSGPDCKKAYVVNHEVGTVSELDLVTGKVTKTIPVGNGPYAITISGNKAYVANYLDSTVSVINTTTGTVTKTITVGWGPLAIATSGNKVYVANYYQDNTVSVIDTTSDQVTKTIAVGGGPSNIAISGNKAYVLNHLDGTVSVIDLGTGRVTQTIRVESDPEDIAICGSQAFVSNGPSNTVSVINLLTQTITATVPVGKNPCAIEVCGGKVYVANYDDGTVSVIDILTSAVTATIRVGNAPSAIATCGDKAYVTNSGDGTVSVIDAATGTVTATLPAGRTPKAIVIGP